MWQLIIGLVVGGLAGFFVCSALTVGKQADLISELQDCKERVRRLAQG